MDYADVDGRRVVTAITVDGIKLHRAFAVQAGDVPVRIILSEARSQGWETQCLQACLNEISHTIKKREQREMRRRSTRSSLSEGSPTPVARLDQLSSPRE